MSDLIVQLHDGNKSYQKFHLNNIMSMINLSGCIILPAQVTKIVQTRKIQRFDKSDTDISDLIIKCF